MNKILLVYDEQGKNFRELDTRNYNDDLIIGTLFFSRDSLAVIQKYCHVCGYIIINNKDGDYYPIDIHDNEIVMFEGTYNCLPPKLKKELIQYNIHEVPSIIWSSFFFKWQFLCDWHVFEDCGSFIQLCSNIIGSEDKFQLFLQQPESLVFPVSYRELCTLAQLIQNVFNIDLYNSEYIEEFNYVVDGLIHNYHINMTPIDIIRYCYQMCTVANGKWR